MADHRPDVYRDTDSNRWVFRASSITRCVQSLIAAGLGYEALPPPDTLQRAWDEGAAGEDEVLRMFRDHESWHAKSAAIVPAAVKWRALDPADLGSYHDGHGHSFPFVQHRYINDDQFSMEIPVGGAVIRGHLDGIVECYQTEAGAEGMGERAIVEAKLFGVDYHRKWVKHGIAAFPDYAWQLSLYMKGTGLPAWFIVGEKKRWADDDPRITASDTDIPVHLRYDIASVHVTRFDEPPVPVAKIKARVLSMVRMLEGGELPACDKQQFPCAYSYLHDGSVVELAGTANPVKAEEPEPVKLDGEVATEVAELAGKYASLTTRESAAKKAKGDIKARLDELLPREVGVAGRWDAMGVIVEWVHEDAPARTVEYKASVKSYPKVTVPKGKKDEGE